MATTTTNYSLVKPDYADAEDVEVLNDDLDSIDTILKSNADATAAVAADLADLDTVVDGIETSIAVPVIDTGWIDISPGGFFTSGTLHYRQLGPIIFVRASGTVSTTADNIKAISAGASLPDAYRPSLVAVSGARFTRSGSPDVAGWAAVEIDGQINICQNEDTCTAVAFTISYPKKAS